MWYAILSIIILLLIITIVLIYLFRTNPKSKSNILEVINQDLTTKLNSSNLRVRTLEEELNLLRKKEYKSEVEIDDAFNSLTR